jgi:hypothetical protein
MYFNFGSVNYRNRTLVLACEFFNTIGRKQTLPPALCDSFNHPLLDCRHEHSASLVRMFSTSPGDIHLPLHMQGPSAKPTILCCSEQGVQTALMSS